MDTICKKCKHFKKGECKCKFFCDDYNQFKSKKAGKIKTKIKKLKERIETLENNQKDNLDLLNKLSEIDNHFQNISQDDLVKNLKDCGLEVKEPPYEERQAKWLEDNDIKVGDKVKVLRKADNYENGWGCSWVERMDCWIGKEITINSINSKYGIQQNEGIMGPFPYFILEKVKENEIKLPEYLESWENLCTYMNSHTIYGGPILNRKIYATIKLQWIAKQLNGDWEPDWNDENDYKWYIYYYNGDKTINYDCKWSSVYGIVHFKSEEIAKQALEIMGNDIYLYFGLEGN